MKKLEIMNTMTRAFHKTSFKVQKHSPEILVVAGVVGVVTSAVMACKATTKLDTILDDSKEKVEKIEGYVATTGYSDEYTEEDHKKDRTIVTLHTGMNIAKL